MKRQQIVWLFLGLSVQMIPGIDWRNLFLEQVYEKA